MIAFDSAPQGSEAWLSIRRGRVTASRFRDARDKLKSGAPSAACLSYAMDCARERCGGKPEEKFQTAAMRFGSEQEAVARTTYENVTGHLVEQVGFVYTEDGRFGASVDGLIDDDGVWECKTLVSSAVLFNAIVDGNISAYVDQCMGALWLLGRKWTDLTLWCPDLQLMHTIRIQRDDDYIEALEFDLLAFDRLVCELTDKLGAAMRGSGSPPDAAPAPVSAPPTPAAVPPPADEAPTLKLGDIGARLGFVLGQQFIADKLGIHAAGRQKNAVLYHEADFARICDALAIHITTTKKEHAR